MERIFAVKPFMTFITFVAALSVLTGCSGQDDSQVAERARLEGKAQAEEQLKKDRELLEEQTRKQKQLQDEQIEKQRELQDEQIKKERGATDSRAKEMEKSLAKLQDFYEDNSGVYEGAMTRGADKFSIRITLSPSIPRYSDSRTRTPSEIEADLTTLSYNAQILQWIPPSKDSVGCRINGLKPNTKKGTLSIISPDCPSGYSLTLNRTSISGTAQSETNPDAFEIYAERTSKSAPAPKKSTKKGT
jgi:hypothetical protein